MSRRFQLGLALLVLLALARYGWAIDISFINDDFLFLERARTASFLDNWNFHDALGNVYRPLTRNLYFWLGLRLLGRDPAPYHWVNLTLVGLSLILTALFTRRLVAEAAGVRPDSGQADGAGLLAALLFGLHPSAGTPASWVCGVQDLLALDLALAAGLAHLAGRRVLYLALYVAALLSKETTAFLFVLVALWDGMVKRSGWRAALGRQAPPAALFLLWLLGNRWLPWNDLGSTIHSREPGQRSLLGRFDLETVAITVRSLFLVQPAEAFRWPHGWAATSSQILLAAGIFTLARMTREPVQLGRGPLLALAVFACGWSLSSILPLVTVISHFVYYAYYPAFGFALFLAALAVKGFRSSGTAARAAASVGVAILVAALLASAGIAYHASLCDAHNIRRASAHLRNFRADLLRLHPTLPEKARVYFWNIPYWIGFQLADGPALRVWYGDSTLAGAFLSAYVPAPGRPTLFFGHDDAMHLIEIVRGLPDPQLHDPPAIYTAAHNDLGATLATAGEPEAALIEWRKVLEVDPNSLEAAANLGITLNRLGRFGESAPVLEGAARLDPNAADVRLSLGQAYLSLGRYPEALTSFETFLRLAPDARERPQVEEAVRALRAELARRR
jgi:tetratricopeptide (TPR) repeat protein